MCGSSGATRTGTVYEYEERFQAGHITPRRDLVCQTDRLQCERCGGSWDEVADIKTSLGSHATSMRRVTSPRVRV